MSLPPTSNATSNQVIPDVVAAAGVHRARELDVRHVLSKGGDPFQLIVKTTKALAGDEALHLIVGFEPKPLYTVMRMLGRAAHTSNEGGTYHVWFYREGGAPKEAGPVAAPRVPLQPPFELDVRGLEPPAPMVAILEKLAELGDGAQLIVHHHRDPVLLYDKLTMRGYAARAEEREPGHFVVRIAPEWAFEKEPAKLP